VAGFAGGGGVVDGSGLDAGEAAGFELGLEAGEEVVASDVAGFGHGQNPFA
jgi:hypothetical protein